MQRRAFLGASVGALAAAAGCLGNSSSSSSPRADFNHPGNLDTAFAANMDLPADGTPADGYPPEYGDDPAERSVDESSFGTLSVNGESVTLAPIDVTRYWHRREAARFVDARGVEQYKRAHVFGAVNSPAVKDSQGGGIDDWPTDDRVVCYCACPHHLSSIRAAGLQKAGFSNVYVIDEGFGAWYDRGYPMRGTDFSEPKEAVIEGEVAATYAGEYAWATHDPSGQQEAAPIRDDGTFTLHLRFDGLDGGMPIHVSTPAFEVTRPLAELTDHVLTG